MIMSMIIDGVYKEESGLSSARSSNNGIGFLFHAENSLAVGGGLWYYGFESERVPCCGTYKLYCTWYR